MPSSRSKARGCPVREISALLPVLHTFFMDDKRAQELTLRFLNDGHFESDETRQPIAKD